MYESLRLIGKFLLLVAVQVLILNNIHLFGLISPYLYILFILTLPLAMSLSLVMLIAFALGFIIDIFCNSYGIHTSATVLAAFLRPYIVALMTTREQREKIQSSFDEMGLSFFLYAAILVVIHHFTLFLLEAFSFAHIGMILLKTVCSASVTLILIACVYFLKPKHR